MAFKWVFGVVLFGFWCLWCLGLVFACVGFGLGFRRSRTREWDGDTALKWDRDTALKWDGDI